MKKVVIVDASTGLYYAGVAEGVGIVWTGSINSAIYHDTRKEAEGKIKTIGYKHWLEIKTFYR